MQPQNDVSRDPSLSGEDLRKSILTEALRRQHLWANDYLSGTLVPYMKPFDGNIIAVVHVTPQCVPFLNACRQAGNLVGVIPKPKSIDEDVLSLVAQTTPILRFTREGFVPGGAGLEAICKAADDRALLLLDIGGYFCPIADDLVRRTHLKAILEDTTNGHYRYAGKPRSTHVLSIARDATKKEFEDAHVADDIVIWVVHTLKKSGLLSEKLKYLVVGFGHIGEGLAWSLATQQSRIPHSNILISDSSDAIRSTAGLYGFNIGGTSRNSSFDEDFVTQLRDADVIFATAPHCLSERHVQYFKDGVVVVSVTSAEDTLVLDEVFTQADRRQVDDHLVELTFKGRRFFLVNNGDAPNFLRGAGFQAFPGIHATHGLLLSAIDQISRANDLPPGVHSIEPERSYGIRESYLNSLLSLAELTYAPNTGQPLEVGTILKL